MNASARILNSAHLQATLNLEHTARQLDIGLAAAYMAESEPEAVHYSRAWRTAYRSVSYAATLTGIPTE